MSNTSNGDGKEKRERRKRQSDTLASAIRDWIQNKTLDQFSDILRQHLEESVATYDWASSEERPLYVAEQLAELGGKLIQDSVEFLRRELDGAYSERLRAVLARAESRANDLSEEEALDQEPQALAGSSDAVPRTKPSVENEARVGAGGAEGGG